MANKLTRLSFFSFPAKLFFYIVFVLIDKRKFLLNKKVTGDSLEGGESIPNYKKKLWKGTQEKESLDLVQEATRDRK